jgi:RHS repeat-associated protein
MTESKTCPHDSFVMQEERIDKVLFDGGYFKASQINGTTYGFTLYYYNKDHLGNNREVLNASGTVQQVTNYYPFGAPYADPAAVVNASFQPYKYNGKELDTMHGLNTYDYGARQHYPILARWDRVDPLCEKYYSISPYAYCENNPMNAIDPDGREVIDGLGSINKDNENLKELAEDLVKHDDPNSIMIVAHGVCEDGEKVASSINIRTYDSKTEKWNDNYISDGKQFSSFLSKNSCVWKDFKAGKIEAKDMHIVFYGCSTGDVAKQISSSDEFKDITFIAPNKDIGVDCKAGVVVSDLITKDGKTMIDNSYGKGPGNWNTYRNGRVPFINSQYPGNRNLKPGTANFKYNHTFL